MFDLEIGIFTETRFIIKALRATKGSIKLYNDSALFLENNNSLVYNSSSFRKVFLKLKLKYLLLTTFNQYNLMTSILPAMHLTLF